MAALLIPIVQTNEPANGRTAARRRAASAERLVRHLCRSPGTARQRHQEHIVMTTSRVQLALNVTDIDAATAFYRDLFGVEPAKQRPGYANFEIPDPPLKLVLFHNPDAASPLNHLGVEVATPAEVVAAAGRFAGAGLDHTMTEGDRCCHAVQDKVWVDAPDVPLGAWEFYTVLADDPGQSEADPTGACCTTTSTDSGPCCAGVQEA
jgi:catechol 2,3-dioxygenase-like lactoylglutathione lyase family enzyme